MPKKISSPAGARAYLPAETRAKSFTTLGQVHISLVVAAPDERTNSALPSLSSIHMRTAWSIVADQNLHDGKKDGKNREEGTRTKRKDGEIECNVARESRFTTGLGNFELKENVATLIETLYNNG